MESAMDFMSNASECGSPAPQVINISGGAAGFGQTGTDSTSRKLDDKVWTNRQAYVVCSGNSGPGSQTIWSPGVAKNALTVGNVFDNGYLSVGDLNNGSSRGPTGDGRMKPNLVGPGTVVTSALAGTKGSYTDMSGCSMATPHVSGLAATLMEHYPEFRSRPALLRAHMMASAIAHDDVTGKSNDFGLGRVSGYLDDALLSLARCGEECR
jgi:serine protease AprX